MSDIPPATTVAIYDSTMDDDAIHDATTHEPTVYDVRPLREYINDITTYDVAKLILKELMVLETTITTKFPPLKVIILDSIDDAKGDDAKDDSANEDASDDAMDEGAILLYID